MAADGKFDLLSFLQTVSSNASVEQEAKEANGGSEQPASFGGSSIKTDVTHAMAPPVVAPPAPEAAAEREERSQAFNDPVDKRILGAAHSSAANAFAAAAVSTKPIPNRPAFTPRGQLLPDQRSLVCDVMGGVCPAEEQLEVSPITMYQTEYHEERRRQVAVNNSYICYSLRQGPVRVLNKLSAARALHKAHTKAVTDLRFFSDEINLIASCGKDRSLFVYRVIETPDIDEISISPIVTFHLKPPGDPEQEDCMTLAWHTILQDMLVFTSDRSVYACNLEGCMDQEHTLTADSTLESLTVLKLGSRVTNASFSPDGKMLAAAAKDGDVRIWPIEASSAAADICSSLNSSTPCVFKPYGQGRDTRVFWIPVPPQVGAQVLLTTGPVDRDLRLWTVDSTGKAEASQALLLDGPGGDESFFNHIHMKPELQLIIIANTKANAVYTVHYSLKADPSQPVCFRYVARFAVTMPVLSMTATWNSPIADGAAETIQLYCVQTQAVQQYTLHPELCCPDADALASAPSPAPVPHGLVGFRAGLRMETGQGDIDEFASSAGFATAGSVLDPADIPEPDASEMAESEVVDSEYAEFLSDMTGDVQQPKDSSLDAQVVGRSSTSDSLDDGNSRPVAPAGGPPNPTPRLLTPNALLATARRTASTQSNNMPHDLPSPSAATASAPSAPSESASTSSPGAAAAFASAEQMSQVLTQLHGLQTGLTNMEKSLGVQISGSLQSMEGRLSTFVAAQVKAAVQEQKKYADEQLAELATANQKQMEELLRLIYGFLSADLPKQLDTAMQQHSASMAAKMSEVSRAALTSELSKALKPPEESTAASRDALEAAVVDRVVPAMQAPLREGMSRCFQSTLLPRFEAAVKEMFAQLDSTVSSGVKHHLETSGQQAMQVVAESLAPTAAIMDSMRTDMKQFHTKIHEAISSGLAPSASASMPPTAPKGVVSLAEIEAAQDPTIKLSGLIRQREYEKAFTEALTLSNVNMVTWLCKQLDPKVVLAEPEHGGPLLSQGVQLSLVQQLGSALEMPSDIEVKLDWIQEACLVLDPHDRLFAPHIRGILTELVDQVKHLVERSRGMPFEREGRFVVHLAQMALKSCP